MSIVTCRSHLSCRVPWRASQPSETSLIHYVGGTSGSWCVESTETFSGPELKPVTHLEIIGGRIGRAPQGTAWILPAIVSSTRYITREEPRSMAAMKSRFPQDGTPSAALVLIRKSAEWWDLAGEERRDIIEARSRQVDARLRTLPAIARRFTLHRDGSDAFDFLTWFEFDAQDSAVIDDLASAIRATDEWNYVEREIEIRLSKMIVKPR